MKRDDDTITFAEIMSNSPRVFGKMVISGCSKNSVDFNHPMNFKCLSCGHTWVATSGGHCIKCNGADLVIESQP